MIKTNNIPKHIAIIMDGNGRWATHRNLPRVAGHKAGLDAVRKVIRAAGEAGVEVLSLFAFSSENWGRPRDEVSALMELFSSALTREVKKLHQHQIQVSFIGDLSRFSDRLRKQIQKSEQLTRLNTGLKLVIAVNYGGHWDILQATQAIAKAVSEEKLALTDIDATCFERFLVTQTIPAPDLFIRSSGEKRISNFFLWQLAYTELYFTDILWPDFDETTLQDAIAHYQKRERRFGGIQQLHQTEVT